MPRLKMETKMISIEKSMDDVTAEIRGNFTPNSHIDVGSEDWITSGAKVGFSISLTTEVASERAEANFRWGYPTK